MLEHLKNDMEIIGLFHVVLIAYLSIATLLDVLTLRLDFLFMFADFDRLWGYWYLGFSLLSILGWSRIPTYLSFRTQAFHHWYFHAFYHTRAWSSSSFIPHISPWHIISHSSLDYERCRSILDHFGCAFIHLLDFRFNIFHDSKAWQIVDLLVMMFSFWQLVCWVLICLLFAFRALVIVLFIS